MSIFRSFNISMIPGKPPLIIHVSQYESDFVYTFNLVSGKSVLAIPDTAIAVIRGTKRDGNGYSVEAALDAENHKVVVMGDPQLTACAGRNIFELAILNDEKTICTANFYLDVERAPLDSDTIRSETVLHDLQAIINSAATATQAAEEASASAAEAAESARTLTIDPTLTQSGQPADAKETGDRINEITGVFNLVVGATYVDGKGINASGEISVNDGYRYIDNIAVDSTVVYRFKFSSLIETSNTVRVHGYDIGGNWVKQLYVQQFSTVTTAYAEVLIPDDVAFIKISLSKTQAKVDYIYRKHDLQTQIDVFENDIKNRLSHIGEKTDLSSSFESGYRTVNVETGETVSTGITASSSWRTLLIPCRIGDKFTVTGYGGNASRAWAITDLNLKLIAKAPANTQVSQQDLYINQDGFAIFNYDTSKPNSLSREGVTIDKQIEELETVELSDWVYGYITNGGTVGERFSGAVHTYASNWRCQLVRVHNGDHFTLTAKGGATPRPYCVLNDEHEVLLVGASNSTVEEYGIDVTSDGYMIVNTQSNISYKLTKRVSRDDTIKFKASQIPKVFETVTGVAYNSGTLYTYDEIIAGYDALVSAYPNNITKTALGNDESGTYQIYRYDFIPTIPNLDGYQNGMGAKLSVNDLPIVFMDACIHGNEPPCARALLNLITKIYTSKDTSVFSWIRNHIRFVIIPVANPYGYINNTRGNVNGVDLNRNFTLFWGNGASDSSSSSYRGTSALSEAEAQYIDAILFSLKDKNAIYYSWHTHGVWTSYEKMTCYSYPLTGDTHKAQKIALDMIPLITESGHENHELPLDSGFIGIAQVNIQAGTSANQATCYGLASACPEVMYKYYDGSYGVDYSTKVNCMNVEYMLIALATAYKYYFE